MVVYLDQYRKAKAPARYYGGERLCVNGNPASGVIVMTGIQNTNDLSPDLPEDFTQVDGEALLGRVYALASQI